MTEQQIYDDLETTEVFAFVTGDGVVEFFESRADAEQRVIKYKQSLYAEQAAFNVFTLEFDDEGIPPSTPQLLRKLVAKFDAIDAAG
jgi:hypothetical protein